MPRSRYQLCGVGMRRSQARGSRVRGANPGATPEALLRAAVGEVHAPAVDVDRDPAERRDAVGQQQSVAFAGRHGGHVVANPGAGLGVHERRSLWGAGWASSRAPGSSGRPHGASTRTTSAPQRRATSHIRSPKRPLTPITTMSPGPTVLTNAASMPADPVPDTGRVTALPVPHTVRSRSHVSSSNHELGVQVAEHGPGQPGRGLGVRIARAGAHQDAIGHHHGRRS